MTITSKDNEKLKLVRKLADRKHREREGLFVTEGEDLLKAGRSAGREPTVLLTREGEGLGGLEVERELLDAASTLGSGSRAIAIWPLPSPPEEGKRPGLRPIGRTDGRLPGEGAVCVYLHGVGDPGNVGSIVRSAGALADAWVALGPECADPYGPKAVRASMGAIFSVHISRCDITETPAPRVSLVAHGGASQLATDARTLCLGAERDGLPQTIIDATDATWTIPMRPDAVESLGVAAAAAIALSRIGSRVGE
ncbi:MAG: methyltransferase, TrmH family [Solirubrobacterales bacterium]|jgi:TrmH family RNA methyltransferase|nr:methyltransferase, TrmH family [Solirubrobacterales bacterium]